MPDALRKAASLPGVTAVAPDGSADVLVTCEDSRTVARAYEALKDDGRIEWVGPLQFYVREGAEHRRCESCGQAMRPRMHRVTDANGRKICDNCQRSGLGEKEWSVAYASLPPAYQAEAETRHEATVAGLAVLAEVRKCPACGGQGSYEDDETGQERSCPRCGGDGVLDAPKKTSGMDLGVWEDEGYPKDGGYVSETYTLAAGTYLRVGGRPGEFYWGLYYWGSDDEVPMTEAGRPIEAGGFGTVEQAKAAALADPRVQKVSRTSSLQVTAHDSGDGETIFHCPFCGSGAVSGGADGTVTCDFCHTAFTVQVQPRHTNMPQTVDGQPYNVPGMPGGGPDAGAAQQAERDEEGQAQDGAPAPGSSPAADATKGQSPAADKAAQDGAQAPGSSPSGDKPKRPNPFAKGSSRVAAEAWCPGSGAPASDASWGSGAEPTRTGACPSCGRRVALTIDDRAAPHWAEPPSLPTVGSRLLVEGVALPTETALQALALRHADDRERVLAQVRAENAR